MDASPLDDQNLYARRRAFGRLVAELRRVLQLSQGDFAKRAPITLQRISRLERGHAVPLPAEVTALTTALVEALREALADATPPPVRVIVRGVPAGRYAPSRPAEEPEAVRG